MTVVAYDMLLQLTGHHPFGHTLPDRFHHIFPGSDDEQEPGNKDLLLTNKQHIAWVDLSYLFCNTVHLIVLLSGDGLRIPRMLRVYCTDVFPQLKMSSTCQYHGQATLHSLKCLWRGLVEG